MQYLFTYVQVHNYYLNINLEMQILKKLKQMLVKQFCQHS